MDLEKVRTQVDLIDVKAVKVRQGLDRLLLGRVSAGSGEIGKTKPDNDRRIRCPR